MTPAPPFARRLSMLGCVALGVAALALPACGSDDAAAPAGATATQPTRQARTGAAGKPCPGQVNAFLDSLDDLRSRLAVGLSYEQYAAAMRRLRASYDEIPVGRLAIDCLTATGTPSEKAFNEYVDAANAWGKCLADASCTTASIEPVLQRRWRVASRFLSAAQ